MRAVAITGFGGPEGLREIELPDPTPGVGEILIDVAFAGVNFAEVLARQGKMGRFPLPFVPGLEVAGRVGAVGANVDEFSVGDDVIAFTRSGYAERVVVDARLAARRPAGVSARDGVALACTGVTAHFLLDRVARVRSGETVLVQGATGGVGAMALQVARNLGAARVWAGIGRESKRKVALAMGYDDAFPRESTSEAMHALTEGRGVDIILEGISGAKIASDLGVTAPLGRVVYFGDADFLSDAQLPVHPLRASSHGVLGFSLGNLVQRHPELWRQSADAVLALAAGGKIVAPVNHTFAPEQAQQAHRLLESGESVGKFVISFDRASASP